LNFLFFYYIALPFSTISQILKLLKMAMPRWKFEKMVRSFGWQYGAYAWIGCLCILQEDPGHEGEQERWKQLCEMKIGEYNRSIFTRLLRRVESPWHQFVWNPFSAIVAWPLILPLRAISRVGIRHELTKIQLS
jgi:hypothetical protein